MKQPSQVCAYLLARVKTAGKINIQITKTNKKVPMNLKVGLVCVGWMESYVRSIEEREYLFDLDAGARGLLGKYGRSDELDLIFKSYSNLLRILGD